MSCDAAEDVPAAASPSDKGGPGHTSGEKRVHKRRPTDRQLKRRAAILQAARNLAASNGYDGLTMLDIAKESGVAAKTLYNIYGDKERLLLAAVDARSDDLFGEPSESAGLHGWERLVALLDRASAGIRQTPDLSRAVSSLMFGQWAWTVTNRFFEHQYRLALQEIRAEGDLISWADIDVLTRLMRFEISAVLLLWGRGEITDAQLQVFYRLSMCQILVGLTRRKTCKAIKRVQAAAHAELARLPNVVPPRSTQYACDQAGTNPEARHLKSAPAHEPS